MRTNPKPNNKKPKMKRNLSYNGLSLLIATAALFSAAAPAQAQAQMLAVDEQRELESLIEAELRASAARAAALADELGR